MGKVQDILVCFSFKMGERFMCSGGKWTRERLWRMTAKTGKESFWHCLWET